MTNFGYWIFGKDMLNVNLSSLKSNGVTDVFLNYYAFTTHGESKVLSWIQDAKSNNINVHIWMQCFYDGEWHNPKTTDLNNKIKEAKKYANLKGVFGVHLDYLRYPGNAYKTLGGADAITKFVKDVRAEIPNTFLSCAVMPETDTKYYYGQDIEALGKIVNAILPMQYKGNYQAGTSWLASTTKIFSQKATVWSGLQSYKSDENTALLSSDELLNDCKTCLDNQAKGCILFRYGLSPNINFNKLINTSTNQNNNSDTMGKSIINANVYLLAKTIKEYVEKNKKFPVSVEIGGTLYSNTDIAYIMTYAINNLKANVAIPETKAPSNFASGDSIKEDIYPSDFQDQAKRIIQYIKQNGQMPLYVSTVKSKKKVGVQLFTFAFAKILVWFNTHDGILPNYCTYDSSVFSTSSTTTVTPKSTKSKILNKDVYTLAKTVKESVEKNKKLESNFKVSDVSYTNNEVAYIFSYAINNLKSDITIPTGIKSPSSYNGGVAIDENIYPSDFQDQAKRVVEYIKKNSQLPIYVTTVKSKKQVSVQMFTYAFAKTLVWYANNKNTLPNYTNYNTNVFGVSASSGSTTTTTTTSSSSNGLYSYMTTQGCSGMGQCTGYYCGPNSLQQCLYRLTGVKVDESTLASWAGTTTSGTDHDGLNSAVYQFNKKYGKNVKITWKNFSDLGSSADARWKALQSYIDKGAVFCHLLYRNQWGHYEVPKSVGSSSLSILNSLGDKCSSSSYCGYIETRSKSNQLSYINGISQKSICILTKG